VYRAFLFSKKDHQINFTTNPLLDLAFRRFRFSFSLLFRFALELLIAIRAPLFRPLYPSIKNRSCISYPLM